MQSNFEEIGAYDDHEMIIRLSDVDSGLRGYISVHRRFGDHPVFGATRIKHYNSEFDALKDSLNLSRMMTYKNIMAGLKNGGAKAVIITDNNLSGVARAKIFKAYAQRLNFLSGSFVTGTDVGMSQEDLMLIKQSTKHISGVESNPSLFTALGLELAIEMCFDKVLQRETQGGTI